MGKGNRDRNTNAQILHSCTYTEPKLCPLGASAHFLTAWFYPLGHTKEVPSLCPWLLFRHLETAQNSTRALTGKRTSELGHTEFMLLPTQPCLLCPRVWFFLLSQAPPSGPLTFEAMQCLFHYELCLHPCRRLPTWTEA